LVLSKRQDNHIAVFRFFLALRVALSHPQVRLDHRVLKVVENRVVSALSKELLIETLQVSHMGIDPKTAPPQGKRQKYLILNLSRVRDV